MRPKIVEETSPYDNVYYEICNEPGGNANPAATTADVDAWQTRIAEVVRQELKRLGRKHLIFGSQAFSYSPSFRQELDRSFSGKLVDAVTVHPLPGMVLGGREFMLGHFMSKELALKDFRDFCRASQAFAKPCVPDEDNAASMYRDETGWTIHRKRAWTSVLSLCHYDYIDFSITVGSETGTHASNRLIRTWIKHLSDFITTIDVVHARVAADWILRKPPHLIDSALALPGGEYVAYLADDREVTDPECGSRDFGRAFDPSAGGPLPGEFLFPHHGALFAGNSRSWGSQGSDPALASDRTGHRSGREAVSHNLRSDARIRWRRSPCKKARESR